MYIGKEKEKRWEFLTVKEQDNHRPNFVWLIFFIHNTIIAYFPGEISIFFRKKVFRIYEVFSTYQLIFFFNLQFSALFNDRRSLKLSALLIRSWKGNWKLLWTFLFQVLLGKEKENRIRSWKGKRENITRKSGVQGIFISSD